MSAASSSAPALPAPTANKTFGMGAEGDSPNNASSADGNSDTNPTRPKRSRTRTGCFTCRKRRKLCDMQKPVCNTCSRLSLQCQWPEPGLSARDYSVPRLRKRVPSVVGGNNAVEPLSGYGNGLEEQTTDSPSERPASRGRVPLLDMWAPVVDPFPGAQTFVDSTVPTTHLGEWGQYTLQQWAAELLDCGTTFDPWTLDSVLAPPGVQGASNITNNATGQMYNTGSMPPSNVVHGPKSPLESPLNRRPDLPTNPLHRPLLTHYQDCLSRLVACNSEEATNGFDAFTTLASATASTLSGKALHLATLAWAGCHMSNQGQDQFEALSESVADEARKLLMSAPTYDVGSLSTDMPARFEKMSILGGLLMIMSFKICRGDIWGYHEISERLRTLSSQLFEITPQSVELVAHNSMVFGLFENLVYHDILSTSGLVGPGYLVPTQTLEAIALASPEHPNTLMGTSLRLFCILRKTLDLIRAARGARSREVDDEALADLMASASELEQRGLAEKARYAELVKSRSAVYDAWQYMHEGFRVASLLALRAFVLGVSPHSTQIRLLVRQALSLLETMYEQNLPGFCSAHFVIFITGLCAGPGGVREGQLDDRQRVERLYENTIDDLSFNNVKRSRHIVRLVWKRNQEGKLFVDWLDIIQQYNWELYLV